MFTQDFPPISAAFQQAPSPRFLYMVYSYTIMCSTSFHANQCSEPLPVLLFWLLSFSLLYFRFVYQKLPCSRCYGMLIYTSGVSPLRHVYHSLFYTIISQDLYSSNHPHDRCPNPLALAYILCLFQNSICDFISNFLCYTIQARFGLSIHISTPYILLLTHFLVSTCPRFIPM